MATVTAEILSSDKNFIKTTYEFETNVKEKLNWNRGQWTAAGECGSKINKLCNSANYWKFKLKSAFEETGIIITLFNEKNDVSISLTLIVDAIEGLNLNVDILGFTGFRNPRYIAIYFKNKEERDKVKTAFRMVEDSFVFYLSWAFEAQELTRTLKVHWLPITLDIKVIERELNKYVECVEHERHIITLMSGRDFAVGKVSFKVKVKKGVQIESIPHVMCINDLEALITINGRQPLCLNCDRLGHISRDCKMRFCNVCKAMKDKEHTCQKSGDAISYAAKVKSGKACPQPDDWGDSITVKPMDKQEVIGETLANKIAGIEKQIFFLQAEDLLSMQTRLEHKRKAEVFGNKSHEDTDEESLNSDLTSASSGASLMEEGGSLDNEDSKVVQLNSVRSMTEAETEKIKTQSNKKRNRKNNSKKTTCKQDDKTGDEEVANVFKTYGKPNRQNARRIKEQQAFQKLLEKSPEHREFVFKD